MSKRSRMMVQNLNTQNGQLELEHEQVQPQPEKKETQETPVETKAKGRENNKRNDDAASVSSWTPSEVNVLNPKFIPIQTATTNNAKCSRGKKKKKTHKVSGLFKGDKTTASGVSSISVMTPSEQNLLNPQFKNEIHSQDKCKVWLGLEGKALKDTTPKKHSGLVPYSPSSRTTNTQISCTLKGNGNFDAHIDFVLENKENNSNFQNPVSTPVKKLHSVAPTTPTFLSNLQVHEDESYSPCQRNTPSQRKEPNESASETSIPEKEQYFKVPDDDSYPKIKKTLGARKSSNGKGKELHSCASPSSAVLSKGSPEKTEESQQGRVLADIFYGKSKKTPSNVGLTTRDKLSVDHTPDNDSNDNGLFSILENNDECSPANTQIPCTLNENVNLDISLVEQNTARTPVQKLKSVAGQKKKNFKKNSDIQKTTKVQSRSKKPVLSESASRTPSPIPLSGEAELQVHEAKSHPSSSERKRKASTQRMEPVVHSASPTPPEKEEQVPHDESHPNKRSKGALNKNSSVKEKANIFCGKPKEKQLNLRRTTRRKLSVDYAPQNGDEGIGVLENDNENDDDYTPDFDKPTPEANVSKRTSLTTQTTSAISNEGEDVGSDLSDDDEDNPWLFRFASDAEESDNERDIEESESEFETTWDKRDLEEQAVEFINFEAPEEVQQPIDYFKSFFNDDIFQLMVDQTNLYSTQQTGKSLEVTMNEMKRFLGVWIYMGIMQLPAACDYWAGATRVSQVADVMTSKRFERLRRFIHFVDNETASRDHPFWKVKPLMDHMRQVCLQLPQRETQFSIDESLSRYKGRKAGGLRQYVANKPYKWGFKIYNLAGVSGMVYDFLAYCGEKTFEECNSFTEEEKDFNFGPKVVVHLAKSIKHPESSTLCFDNFFTYIYLLEHLKDDMKLLSLGTLRASRMKDVPLTEEKELVKQGRGSYDVAVSSTDVAVVRWVDNKTVNVASTYVGVGDEESLQHLKRWIKKKKEYQEIPCPKAVITYNQSMGGVDTFDHLMEIYRPHSRSKRWYTSIIVYFINMALVNSWLIYRKDCELLQKNYLPSKQFRLEVCKTLMAGPRRVGRPGADDGNPKKLIKSPITPRPCLAVRRDKTEHWPLWDKKKRCKYCHNGYTSVSCAKCEINLCFVPGRNCFLYYHTADDDDENGNPAKDAEEETEDGSV